VANTARRRSRPYPAFDLKSSYEDLETVVGSVDRGESKAIAKALGYKSGEGGAAIRRIAAMVHFGFLERDGEEYVASPLAERILDLSPDDESYRQEFREHMVEALARPEVFADALTAYQKGEVSPEGLGRFFQGLGITRKASGRVADLFLRSCDFAEVQPPTTAHEATTVPVRVGSGERGGWLIHDRALPLGPSDREARLSLALVVPEDLEAEEYEVLCQRLQFELNLELGRVLDYHVELDGLPKRPTPAAGKLAPVAEFRERK
jgi:hypothetical protein